MGKALSVVDLIKKMNQAFHYNDPDYYRLPGLKDLQGAKTPEALLGQYVFYVDKFSRKDRQSFVDTAKASRRFERAGKNRRQLGERDASTNTSPPSWPAFWASHLRQKGIKVSITGIGSLYKEASDLLIIGQMWSVALSMAIVLVLVAVTMRSLVYGLLSILPLSITILFNFGLMGFMDIPLDPGTAIIACVAVGIGVDYSIHYLNRYRLEREKRAEPFGGRGGDRRRIGQGYRHQRDFSGRRFSGCSPFLRSCP